MNALRHMSVDNQVGLLFVMLLGLLLAGTAWLFARSVKEPEGQDESGRENVRRAWRELRALWLGATVFWLAWAAGSFVATLLFGVISFVALREFLSLAPTRRGDHRALLLAFFAVLPMQYVAVGLRWFDLFTVFIPVYAFLALPVISAVANDPTRFLERSAKIQFGIMVCVYGLSHAPALLLLNFRGYEGRGAFLLFFLVMVTAAAQLAQEVAARRLRRRPVVRRIDRQFSWRAWGLGTLAAALVGAALFWITPFRAEQAVAVAALAGAAGTLGELVMKALKKDAGVRYWGNAPALTGAVGLLDRVAPLCFAAPVFFHSVRWKFGA
jgi:phosphatidate cytidylyltransferase